MSDLPNNPMGEGLSDVELGTFCRDEELSQLLDHVRRGLNAVTTSEAPDGEATTSLVLLQGSSGMGKSRLSERTREAAEEMGVRVRETFCYERQGIPFLPLLRLVKELISESADQRALWSRYAHVLGRVFPELANELGESGDLIELPGEDGKVQFFDALTSLLSELSREKPILLIVHDLHRSDRGTVDFIEYLARNAHLNAIGRRSEASGLSGEVPPRGWREIRSREGRDGEYIGETLPVGTLEGAFDADRRWMVLANYRGPREGIEPSPVVEGIEALAGEPYSVKIDLAPLGVEAIEAISRRILGADLPSGTIARLTAGTGGNPLHLLEVCRALEGGADPEVVLARLEGEGGAAAVDAPAEEDRVASLFRSRLESLSEGCRSLVDVLAVLRRPTTCAALGEILDRSIESISADLETLAKARFVHETTGVGADRSFLTHEDYVRWSYDTLDPEIRRRLHGRVGRWLSEQERASEPVRAFEIYEHLRASETPQDALSYGLTAARYFSRAYAGELAVRILRELRPLVSEPQRRELVLELALLERDHDDLAVAKSHLKEFLEDEELTPAQRVGAVLHLAEIYRRLDEPLKGIKHLNRLPRDVVAEAGGVAAARISEMRGRLRLQRQDPKRAISLCLRGLQELEAAGADLPGLAEQRARLQEVLADAHRARGDVVSAIHGYQALLEQVEALGDDVQLVRVLRVVGRVYYDRGNHFRAGRYLFRALEGIQKTQDIRALASTYDLLGKVSRNSGDFVRSLEYFRRCLHLRERVGDTEALSPTLNSVGSLYAHSGDYELAIRYFKRSVSTSERTSNTGGLVRGFLHLGWVYSDLGERKQVESLSKQILILAQEFNLNDLEGEGHRLLGNLHFVRSQFKEAEREFRRALEIAQRRGLGKLEAAATLDLGMLLAEREELDGARKRITKGLLLAEELHVLPQQVRGHMLKGEIARLQKTGAEDKAIESYRRGLELVAGGTLLPLQFELEAAMARTHQANLEFESARECYTRAERIFERIAAGLPEDMRVVYQDDRRRKNFLDDLQRFRRESSGRPAPVVPTLTAPGQREVGTPELPGPSAEPIADWSRVGQALSGMIGATSLEDWSSSLLAEARRLVPAPRGFFWEQVTSGDGRVLAQSDMGPIDEWGTRGSLPIRLAQCSIDDCRPLHSGATGWAELLARLSGESAVRSRSVAVIPVDLPGCFQGALFLERPSAGNPFSPSELQELQQMVELSRGQLSAFVQLRDLRRFAGTGILTPAGFEGELERLVGLLADEKRPLGTVELTLPGIDLLLRHRPDGAIERELFELVGGEEATAVRLAADHLLFLVPDVSADSLRDRRESILSALESVRDREKLPPEPAVQVVVSGLDAGDAERVEQLRACGVQAFGAGAFHLSDEISDLCESGLTLKEAKMALERRFITSELLKTGGNITRAAESLGVHRPQLSTLIKKHGVRREDFEMDR